MGAAEPGDGMRASICANLQYCGLMLDCQWFMRGAGRVAGRLRRFDAHKSGGMSASFGWNDGIVRGK